MPSSFPTSTILSPLKLTAYMKQTQDSSQWKSTERIAHKAAQAAKSGQQLRFSDNATLHFLRPPCNSQVASHEVQDMNVNLKTGGGYGVATCFYIRSTDLAAPLLQIVPGIVPDKGVDAALSRARSAWSAWLRAESDETTDGFAPMLDLSALKFSRKCKSFEAQSGAADPYRASSIELRAPVPAKALQWLGTLHVWLSLSLQS